MKRCILVLILTITITSVLAQQIEYSIQINSGLFSFRGKSAADVSDIIVLNDFSQNYTKNPYGTKHAISYGLLGEVKLITQNNFILGIHGGYEVLRSKVNVNHLPGAPSASTNAFVTEYILTDQTGGYTILTNHFVNIHPFFGYRIAIKKIAIDLATGIDLGLGLNSRENGTTQNDYRYTFHTNKEHTIPPTDSRLQFDIKLAYKKIGVSGSYAIGFTNYMINNMVTNFQSQNNQQEAYSKLLRFGLTYRIN